MFEPVQKQTVSQSIIMTILEMVVKGELRPGCALPSERDLATSLGVSRTSVREALKALAYNGLLDVKPGSGSFITDKALKANISLSNDIESLITKHKSDHRQLIEARRVLETNIAALTAVTADEECITLLQESLENMETLLSENAFDAYTTEDIRFHDLIAKNCGNSYLYNAYNQLIPSIVEVSRLGEAVPGRHSPAMNQHKEIFYAIKMKDPESVRILMKEHIDFCEKSMYMYFDSIY